MRIATCLAAIFIALTSIAFGQLQHGQPLTKQAVVSNLASQPLAFTENRGQWGNKTLFRAEAGGATFYFCKDEVAYLFTRNTSEIDQGAMDSREFMPGFPGEIRKPVYKKETMLIKARFVGANPNLEIIGENRLSYNCNYFYGNEPNKWATNVPNYSSITYKDIWLGIDLCYHGNGKGMKYDFIINPGANVSDIRIHYVGVDDLSISNSGDLEAQTRFGMVYENIPMVYQEVSGHKQELTGKYVIRNVGEFGFEVEGYDPNNILVIDPELVYSTFLGGSAQEFGMGIAVDNSGYAYIMGYTVSSDFPMINPYDPSYNGNKDVFVSKLGLTGSQLIYSTYLGGDLDDYGGGIAVDNTGCAYITGCTNSLNFPTQNAYDPTLNGSNDVFITKLSANGNNLIYSTFLGGSSGDGGYKIAINNLNQAFVTGWTWSPNFPTLNAYGSSYNNSGDCFITKLTESGNALAYSTFLGGGGFDLGTSITIDQFDNAYVTGYTESSDFPRQNAFDTSYNGGTDIFVTKISPTGSNLIYSTYFGGSNYEIAIDIDVSELGNGFITGKTYSSDFPLQNPFQTHQPDTNAFITQFSSNGQSLIYSTYLGGNDIDIGYGIAVDKDGTAIIAGSTNSNNFPLKNAFQNDQPNPDIFITKLGYSGDSLIYSTYLGGSGGETAYDLAIDSLVCIYVTGTTGSADFPIISAYDSIINDADAFILKMRLAAPCTYVLGDINSDSQRLGSDVTYGVRYFKALGPQPPDSCYMDSTHTYLYVAGDVNGNCEFRGSDITRLVAYFKGTASLSNCHFFATARYIFRKGTL